MDITLKFIHPTDGRVITVTLDSTMTGYEIIAELIANDFIPPSNKGYYLKVPDRKILVDNTKTFADNNLQSNDHIKVVSISEDSLEHNKETEKNEVVDNLHNTYSNHRKIFISHSSKDSLIVEQVIEILEGFGTPTNKIFCSSFEGYSIGLGENFLDTIKKELNNEVLVLFILSSNFYESPVSLCEMGAAWIRTSEHVPILIPPFKFSDIKGVIPNTQGMMINDKLKLNSLKETVENFLLLKPKKFSAWERKRDNLIRIINMILNDNKI